MRTSIVCAAMATVLAITCTGMSSAAEEANAMELATPRTETADRELIIRFARAYGMALGSSPADGDKALRDPEAFDEPRRTELRQIIDDSGLTVAQWQGMFARMDADAELRERIESLAVPFQVQ